MQVNTAIFQQFSTAAGEDTQVCVFQLQDLRRLVKVEEKLPLHLCVTFSGKHQEVRALLIKILKIEPSVLTRIRFIKESSFTKLKVHAQVYGGAFHFISDEEPEFRDGAIQILKLFGLSV